MNNSLLKQKSSLNLVTFFKGVAIILVILVHSHQKFALSYNAALIPRFGQMGCQIFFLLSSFGLCYSFSKNKISFIKFMQKRLSKIYLGFYFAIFAHLVMRILENGFNAKSVNILGIIINALFLNGLIPNAETNNLIVRGGWFIGTIVVLYALFPLLFKLYNKINKSVRIILFPIITFMVCYFIISILEKVDPFYICSNNSFMYFSFINQLSPFVLGIVLYDVFENVGTNKIKSSLILSVIFLIITIHLFYKRYSFSFKICGFTMALSVMFLFIFCYKHNAVFNAINNNKNIVLKVISSFGKISFQIYLLHSFVVYNLIEKLLPHLKVLHSSNKLWYIVLLPFIYGLCFLVGFIFNKLLNLIKTKKPV